MPTYTRSIDYMVLASAALENGNEEDALTLLTAATQEPGYEAAKVALNAFCDKIGVEQPKIGDRYRVPTEVNASDCEYASEDDDEDGDEDPRSRVRASMRRRGFR